LAMQAAASAAAPPVVPPVPQRFSILVDPCASKRSVTDDDVVVCGQPDKLAPRLAMPRFRGPPDHATPSNPALSAAVALNGSDGSAECGAYGESCPLIANGQAMTALIGGVRDLVSDAFRKKPDKRGRVPIPLDEPVPPTAQP
jgi:hypothetical protein